LYVHIVPQNMRCDRGEGEENMISGENGSRYPLCDWISTAFELYSQYLPNQEVHFFRLIQLKFWNMI